MQVGVAVVKITQSVNNNTSEIYHAIPVVLNCGKISENLVQSLFLESLAERD